MNFLFFFFLTVYGVMTFLHYTKEPKGSITDSGIAMGVFTLFSALAYLADTVFAIINYNK